MVLKLAFAKLVSAGCALVLLCILTSAQTSNPPSAAAKTSSPQKASSTHKSKSKKTKKSASHRAKGQQKIDPQRAEEIQEALIREHYLEGKPTGSWNDATEKAMQRYQADNNWQSKTTPDARALIKLGLGPDHQHLLNPESAMTTQPQGTHGASISSQPSKSDPDKQQR